jgi:hypothetical protein
MSGGENEWWREWRMSDGEEGEWGTVEVLFKHS